MARKERLSEEEELKQAEQAAQKVLAEIAEKRRVAIAIKEEADKQAAEVAAKKRKEERERLAKQWRPICRLSGAYDYVEERGAFADSMNTVELRQNVKTGEVRSFVI